MTRLELTPEVRARAEEVLTEKQMQVFLLALVGYDDRRMAEALNRSRGTIRDHLSAAYRNLRRGGVRFHPNGAPYLDGTGEERNA